MKEKELNKKYDERFPTPNVYGQPAKLCKWIIGLGYLVQVTSASYWPC